MGAGIPLDDAGGRATGFYFYYFPIGSELIYNFFVFLVFSSLILTFCVSFIDVEQAAKTNLNFNWIDPKQWEYNIN